MLEFGLGPLNISAIPNKSQRLIYGHEEVVEGCKPLITHC